MYLQANYKPQGPPKERESGMWLIIYWSKNPFCRILLFLIKGSIKNTECNEIVGFHIFQQWHRVTMVCGMDTKQLNNLPAHGRRR